MKKLLLTCGAAAAFFSTQAQQRLSLYEEFSGENCAPCAALNPALMTLLGANTSKVLLLKYQSPIPTAGPIYEENTIFTDARMDYYSVPFAPYGRIDGVVVGTGADAGNINQTTQTIIDNAAAVASPFTITITNPTYNADGQTFTATATVTAVTAGTYSNLKFRFVLAEQLDYATAPGTNGETSFHNVVRQMYPDAGGQNAPGTWTAGQTQTFTVTGSIPHYVKSTSAHRFFAAFLQTDGDKKVLQAAKTGDITIQLPAAGVASASMTGVGGLKCELPANLTASITLKNTGTQPLTAATIYYRAGTGAWLSQPWTGSVAPGATSAAIPLGAMTATTTGMVQVQDSVALPNTKVDLNTYDNNSSGTVYVLNGTASPLPLKYDLETVNAAWVMWPGTSASGFPFLRASNDGGAAIGAGGSTFVAWYPCQQIGAGANGFMLVPKAELPAGAKAVDFMLAYAMRATTGDKLELLYSTDCGGNWTSVWSKSNADLATVPPTAEDKLLVPTAASYKKISVDITSVPTGAIFGFKATSGGGNNLFIDNIEVRTGTTSGINELVKEGSTRIYPNPTTDAFTVELDMIKASKVSFTIFNALGQSVGQASVKDLTSGVSKTTIDTRSLAPGMYYLNVNTDAGNLQQKFTKL
ncbi:T9SS-dependent choice-of-anchor J family protein [Taibaiella koreensis]|uniref:T9SS-dependent choice-of-anchor J family protein n=1 Tax=Taibaiella koreensis TaxID=1268548 RepID=UPI000E59BEBB|nr:T9SS type A sorting domain-containing protein [Taibaiella koreensis]